MEQQMARPSKLTADTQATICNAVEAGTPLKHAALYAGVGESTVHRWIQQASAPDPEPQFVEFRDAVQRAQARSVTRLVAMVTRAADNDWRAAAWLLERRAPEDFMTAEKRANLEAARAEAEVVKEQAAGKLRYLDRRRGREVARGE
jgi:hypothetical protein